MSKRSGLFAGVLTTTLVLGLVLVLAGCGGQSQQGDAGADVDQDATVASKEETRDATAEETKDEAKEDEGKEASVDTGIWVMTKRTSTWSNEGDDGPKTSESTYAIDEHGNVLGYTTPMYDSEGNESLYRIAYEVDKNGYRTASYFYEIDEQGNVLESSKSGKEHPETKYENTVDAEGRLTSRKKLARQYPEGDAYSPDDFTYEDLGGKDVLTYEKDGRLMRVEGTTVSTRNNGQGERFTVTTVEKIAFDEYGLLESQSYESSCEPRQDDFPDSAQKATYTWNPADDARPHTLTVEWDSGDKSTVTYEYDKNGNVAKQIEDYQGGGTTRHSESVLEWTYIKDPSPAARLNASVFPNADQF